ncbi:MAG: protein translocase subunit SecD [Bacillota bacterium]|nr:protein translocase subunit SecD [Bacillota bacterium]
MFSWIKALAAEPLYLAAALLGAALVVLGWILGYRRTRGAARSRMALITLVVLVLAGAFYFTRVQPLLGMVNLGLDLQGGIHVVMEGVDTPERPVTEDGMRKVVDVISRRVNGMGVVEPVIQRQGARRIIVELPGIKDPDQAIALIGRTAVLTFKDPEGKTVVTGDDLLSADAQIGPGGEYVVALKFKGDGARRFAEATTKYVGQQISIYLDEELVQSPVVQEPIPTGEAIIRGYETYDEAKRVAAVLTSGALPVKLQIVENRTVSATLGSDSIARSKVAVAIAIGLILIFLIAHYRVPGLVAAFALGIYGLLFMGAMVTLNATLTLPGIAGVLLGMGMAVDANIIIFERVREELRTGRTARSAIDSGFSHSLRTIIDSNATTIIAAIVLYYFGTGPIRGFAVTLLIGVVTTIITGVFITRYLLRLVMDSALFGKVRAVWGVRG